MGLMKNIKKKRQKQLLEDRKAKLEQELAKVGEKLYDVPPEPPEGMEEPEETEPTEVLSTKTVVGGKEVDDGKGGKTTTKIPEKLREAIEEYNQLAVNISAPNEDQLELIKAIELIRIRKALEG